MTPEERARRDKYNARRRERYANDPEFRAKCLEANNKSRKGTGKLRYRKELLKRHDDPEYDERRGQQNREKSKRQYAKKKGEARDA